MEHIIIKNNDMVLIIKSTVIFNLMNKGEIETGGILYGYKVSGREEYIITGNTPKQKKDICGKNYFLRKDKRHFIILKELWKKDKSIMYFGDWHYHPTNNVFASNDDLHTFSKLCTSCKTNSKYIINIIASRNEFEVFIYHKETVKCQLSKKIKFLFQKEDE